MMACGVTSDSVGGDVPRAQACSPRAGGLLGHRERARCRRYAALRIAGPKPIGAGALNLHFSDGHRRGIFPFAWLASLDDEALRDGVAP